MPVGEVKEYIRNLKAQQSYSQNLSNFGKGNYLHLPSLDRKVAEPWRDLNLSTDFALKSNSLHNFSGGGQTQQSVFGYRSNQNTLSHDFPSLDMRNNLAPNESLQLLQPSHVRLNNNLMNSTSSKINVVTNDENAANQINKTIFNLHQASPLATNSNSIENIMRDR